MEKVAHTFPQIEDFMEESPQVTASSFRERDTLISQAANLVVRGTESHLLMLVIFKNSKDFSLTLSVMTISINQSHVDGEGSLKEPSTIIGG